MSVGAFTAETFGLYSSDMGLRVNLHGLPWGLPAEHDPTQSVLVPAVVDVGLAGWPLGQPLNQRDRPRIRLDLEGVTQDEFDGYAELVSRLQGRAVEWSPLGSTSGDGNDWTLVSTTAGWSESTHGRWSGPLELWRRGETI